MGTGSRLALALLALAPGPAPAAALAPSPAPSLADVLEQLAARAGSFLLPVQEGRPAPGPIPAGGPSIDLEHLVDPQGLESTLRAAMADASSDRLRITVRGGSAHQGDYAIGSGDVVAGHLLVLRGDALVYGRVEGTVVTLDGDIVLGPAGEVTGEVLALGGTVRELGGRVGGEIRAMRVTAPLVSAAPVSPVGAFFRNGSGLLGVFLTLTTLGFALVLFGKGHLDVVSDTVSHSFGRSFLVGLLGQILLLPTFGMLVVGLALTVVGVLLIPFAVIVYGLLVVVGVVGGFLAVAHAMGETHARRRMARGILVDYPNSYRYMLVGLAGILSIWLVWVVFGWVPVAGGLMMGAAVLATWILATTGFGAALLSRAGIRSNFTGRITPPEAMTDEYLWATPQFGVPAVTRPSSTRTPPSGS